MKTTRRRFLGGLGVGTAATWLTPLWPGAGRAHAAAGAAIDPRVARAVHSICRQCPETCGVLAEVVHGKVKRLRGNPLHPTNRGTLCARGLAAGQLHYNPDRIRQPLRRTGGRGAGGWEPVSWDDALDMICTRLADLRAAGRPHSVAFLAEQLGGLDRILARRFCRAYGTPNYLDLGTYPEDGAVNAATVMQGLDAAPLFDIKRASFLLSFGAPFLDSARNPIQTWKHYAEFRRGKHRPRGRFIHFSAARDATAAKANEWIPVKPGTEGAVALGLAYVMLQEGLYDHDFVKFRCRGFDNWRAGGGNFQGFHEHVRRNYKPARVAEITGVPVDKIVRIAREFALADAPLALWHEGAGLAAQPLSTQMAVHSLNALVGSIDVPGGVLSPRTLPQDFTEPVVPDAVAEAGLAIGPLIAGEHTRFSVPGTVRSSFPQRVVFNSPYPIELLMVYRANPVFDAMPGERYAEALRKIPFSVCVTGFHNETTRWCDLVLPESSALESWCAGPNFTDDGYPFFNLCPPVVPPRHDTRACGEILLDIARRCGGPTAESLPWPRFQDAARAYVEQINALQSGDMFGHTYQEVWTRLLERVGWRARAEMPGDAFWQACLAAGGWWDPVYHHKKWDRALKTTSGRFEFFPQALWQRLRRQRGTGQIPAAEKAQLLPHYAAPAPAAAHETYPLALLVFAMPNLEQVESPNQPWLQEISGSLERQQWHTWVEVNPEDAHEADVSEGMSVWLESPEGRIQAYCRLNEGVQPGTVRCPFGLGHVAGGRWMKDIGVSPAAVVTAAFDPQVGTPNWQTTRVRMVKA